MKISEGENPTNAEEVPGLVPSGFPQPHEEMGQFTVTSSSLCFQLPERQIFLPSLVVLKPELDTHEKPWKCLQGGEGPKGGCKG